MAQAILICTVLTTFGLWGILIGMKIYVAANKRLGRI